MFAFIYFLCTATYDIISATAIVMPGNQVALSAHYHDYSAAKGALFCFVFITESGGVDFSRSAFFLLLDRNASYSHTLPFDLHMGHYRLFVYDIELNGTLSTGVGYPADEDNITSTGEGHGDKYDYCD
jgi:hypothetical protein